jgi:hypothetical protein
VDPFSVIGVAIPAIEGLVKLVKFCKDVYDVPENVLPFLQILGHARLRLHIRAPVRQSARNAIRKLEAFHQVWLHDAMKSMATEMEMLQSDLPKFLREGANEITGARSLGEMESVCQKRGASLGDRLKTVLKVMPHLERRQTSLLLAHGRLMQGINMMQRLLEADRAASTLAVASSTPDATRHPLSLLASWAPPQARASVTNSTSTLQSSDEIDEQLTEF